MRQFFKRTDQNTNWIRMGIFGNFMIKLNRLNHLTTDFNVIVESLNKCKAKLMEISEDKSKIRRAPKTPLPKVQKRCKMYMCFY
jgi:hypothetical protein